MYRLDYAKKYYNDKKYSRAATLFEDVYPLLRATSHGEETLYLLAQSYYHMKDYVTASEYFRVYYTAHPRGEYGELARFYGAYGLYLNSPEPRLDQTDTYKAIQQFQDFLEFYPQTDKRETVQLALFDMQEKLALKELMAARLYYNLGEYILYPFPGGNYSSCVITSQNALRTFPFTKHKEELMYLIFKSKYEIAVKSVDEKKDFRYRDVIDEYFAYVNEFPEGKYAKEITKLYKEIDKRLN